MRLRAPSVPLYMRKNMHRYMHALAEGHMLDRCGDVDHVEMVTFTQNTTGGGKVLVTFAVSTSHLTHESCACLGTSVCAQFGKAHKTDGFCQTCGRKHFVHYDVL